MSFSVRRQRIRDLVALTVKLKGMFLSVVS